MQTNIRDFSFLWPTKQKWMDWNEKPSPDKSYIKDLCIDKILETFKVEESTLWDIEKLFYKPCCDKEVIGYRQDILEDCVEHAKLCEGLKEFCSHITKVKSHGMAKFNTQDPVHPHAWFFETMLAYIEAISKIKMIFNLQKNPLSSRGLKDFIRLLEEITENPFFEELSKDVRCIENEYYKIFDIDLVFNYAGNSLQEVQVLQEAEEQEAILPEGHRHDLIASIIHLSSALCEQPQNEYCRIYTSIPFSQLEEFVLEKLKVLNPDFFEMLKVFFEKYGAYPVHHLYAYKHELEFYLSMADLIDKFKKVGMSLCKPQILCHESKSISVEGVYDLSFALHLLSEHREGVDLSKRIVDNDYTFDDDAKVFVVTGPNQGGKTTFIRAVGITQVLFQVGGYVPARHAVMCPVDAIYTHFPVEEKMGDKMGRLGEEAKRLSQLFHHATKDSMILLNETYSSTRRVDGYALGKDLLKVMKALGCLGIYVTHFNELAYDIDEFNTADASGTKFASLMAGIEDEENKGLEGRRTYKIFASKPSGLAYSKDIVVKHGLTFEQLEMLLQKRGYI